MDTSLKVDRVDPLGGLQLDPSNELRFKGPFDSEFSTVTLSITNPTEKRIAFKIKTTAPKRYCVKPNSGVLDPNKSMKVNVLLQPFSHDANEKLKHKFMVQYMYLNDQENAMEVQDILNKWKDVDSSRLLDIKLKCLFESDVENQQQQQQQPKQQQQAKTQAPNTTSAPSSSQPSSINNPPTSLDSINNDNNNELKARRTAAPTTTTTNPNVSNRSSNKNAETDIQQNYESASSSLKNANLDNYMNETKSLKSENQRLLKEIERLKGEEVRLKKMVLPTTKREESTVQNILVLLNNKSIWIIVVLLAIIIYLILFK